MLNRCEFIGNLGNDIEVRSFPSGDLVGNVNIAVTETWKDRDTGEKKEKTEWVPLIFTGGLVEVMEKYTQKGSKIYVAGKWRTRSWEQGGVTKYRTEVRVDQMELLGDPSGNRQDDRQGQASRGQSRPQGNRGHQSDQRGQQGGYGRQGGQQGGQQGGYGQQRGGQQPRGQQGQQGGQRRPDNGFEGDGFEDSDIPF